MNSEQPEKEQSPLPSAEIPLQSESAMPRSHVRKKMVNQAKRNIILAVVGIAVIIGLLITFGLTAFQKLSDYSVTTKEDTTTENTDETAIIIPPLLDATFDATSSADVTITGTAQGGDEVKLFVNGALTDKKKLTKDTEFEFEDVTLKEGINTIRAKIIKNNKESNFSNEIRIAYYSKEPSLEITTPADGRAFNHDQNPIRVTGKTDPQAKVTVNDYRAIMETDGNFEYTLTLHDGDNDIKIVAEDEAGNKTEKHIKAILQ